MAVMSIAERILARLSRDPGTGDYASALTYEHVTVENALATLTGAFPRFDELVRGRRVVDFGCGLGFQSLALATKYDCTVVGIDTNPKGISKALALARSMNVPESKVSFVDRATSAMKGTFDVVISQNSFEHFGNPKPARRFRKDPHHLLPALALSLRQSHALLHPHALGKRPVPRECGDGRAEALPG